jgi:GMP synthase (glutamine-hydrolysing)
MRPVAVFNAGPFRDSKQPGFYNYCGGDNDALFTRTLGLKPSEVVEVRIQEHAPLPDVAEISGVVVSGSAAMVTDRHPWAERAAGWIADNRDRVPMLGVCFGNQLIAHAFGGRVEWTPKGPEYGTVEIRPLPAAASDPMFKNVKAALQPFAAQGAHSQRVADLPKGGVLLAENDYGLQAARYSDLSWGTQFHPEYNMALMGVLFADFGAEIGAIGIDVPAALRGLAETPVAAAVLRQFAVIVREREAVAA